jgi:hypothetical protein
MLECATRWGRAGPRHSSPPEPFALGKQADDRSRTPRRPQR